MIYTAPCVMLLMRAASITWASGRGLGAGIESFLGPVKWHRADRRMPFGAQKPQAFKKNIRLVTLSLLGEGDLRESREVLNGEEENTGMNYAGPKEREGGCCEGLGHNGQEGVVHAWVMERRWGIYMYREKGEY
jgi:hypothetical protein